MMAVSRDLHHVVMNDDASREGGMIAHLLERVGSGIGSVGLDEILSEVRQHMEARREASAEEIEELRGEVHRLREDNQKLREENEHLREENERLCERVEHLEHRLNQTSRNSHRPPSSDPPWCHHEQGDDPGADDEDDSSSGVETSSGPGAQLGSPGHTRERFGADEADEVVEQTCCPDCGDPLSRCDEGTAWEHPVWELPPIEPLRILYRLHEGWCDGCQEWRDAAPPEEMPSSQFGPRLQGTVTYLTGPLEASKRQAQGALADLFGVSIALGTVSTLEARQSAALAEPCEEAVEALQGASSLHVDETGWNESGERRWLWTATADELAVYWITESRSRAALRRTVPDSYEGIVGRDRYPVYNGRDPEDRQLCWAHLFRDLEGLRTRDGPEAERAALLDQIGELVYAEWHAVEEGECSREELTASVEDLYRPLVRKVLAGGAEREEAPEIFANLLERERALWTFVFVDGVEPTNNEAERALRRGVIRRKTSVGTESQRGNRWTERTLTVCESLRRQERNVHDFLCEAARAHIAGTPPPSLVAG